MSQSCDSESQRIHGCAAEAETFWTINYCRTTTYNIFTSASLT
jgi:hypothetical protein